jgi:hypothetical protein
MFAVPAVISLSVTLAMRVVFVVVDLINGFPGANTWDYGFGPNGLWPLGFLFVSSAVALRSTGDARLFTCQLLSAAALAAWACLLIPVYRSTGTGTYDRSWVTLALSASLSTLLLIAGLVSSLIEHRQHRGIAPVSHRLSIAAREDPVLAHRAWPGFRPSCSALAMTVILLACYHLAVPVPLGGGGFGPKVLLTTASSATAAAASFLLVRRSWSRSLAEAGLGLATLSFCGASLLIASSLGNRLQTSSASLAQRYPMFFCAMIVGFATSAVSWAWLSGYWSGGLARGKAWKTAGRLVPHTDRFAFLSVALATIVAALLAAWPRLRSIAAPDDDYTSIVVGFAANLYLLVATLWCARRLPRLTFHLLTGLALVVCIGFLLLRVLPFAGRIR